MLQPTSHEDVPAKRGLEMRMRKKVTSGIMGLTRPRFGKRSGRSGRLGGGEGLVDLDKLFSQLTQPRFGKRNSENGAAGDLWRCMRSWLDDLSLIKFILLEMKTLENGRNALTLNKIGMLTMI